MTDLIDEVEVDKIEERKVKIFKRIVPIVILLTLAIVSYMTWQKHRAEQRYQHNLKMTDMLVNSVDVVSADADTALKGLNFIEDEAENSLADLAIFEKVKLLQKDNHTNEAMKLLRRLSNEAKGDVSRSYAKILWLAILAEKGDYEQRKHDFEEITSYFQNKKDAFYPNALILAALVYKNNGNNDSAMALLETVINAENVSGISKEEAKALLSQLANS